MFAFSSNFYFPTAELGERATDLMTTAAMDLIGATDAMVGVATEMMPALEAKLGRELSASSRVVACRFPFPNWRPEGEIGAGVDTVWIYKPVKVPVA